MQYFWKKRTIIYFLAALAVIFIHNSSFEQYSGMLNGPLVGLGLFLKNFFAYGIGSVAVPVFFMLADKATERIAVAAKVVIAWIEVCRV